MVLVPIWPAVILWTFSILLISRSVEKRNGELFSFALILAGMAGVVTTYSYSLLYSNPDPFGTSFTLSDVQMLAVTLGIGFGISLVVLGISSAAANLPRWFVSSEMNAQGQEKF